jgi:DNA-binding CsgD family transcriptional regulator
VKTPKGRFRPENLPAFFEAAYDLEANDAPWLVRVAAAAHAVWGRPGPLQAAICDASDVTNFVVECLHLDGFSDEARATILDSARYMTPAFVARTFRSLTTGLAREPSMPEMAPMYEALKPLGVVNALAMNGADPSGHLVYLGIWMREAIAPPAAEMAVYRRMAHHLGAAHRFRRRLRQREPGKGLERTLVDDAEAVLDARMRVLHATGPAKKKTAQDALSDAAKARDRLRPRKATSGEADALGRWHPLTAARWTLVDAFERDGSRYVVARENQTSVRGLQDLSERERQAVAYLAVGQSTKETAYALGISDATVRVLLARAATKLGVRSRAALLALPAVRAISPRPPKPTR